ncbi:MAG TPA: sugar ABC transporter substrate-binding protein [Rudaea sp.]|nr:sugar ABC transporter substrate-binding protein [Rudaea sp.]
MNLARVLRVCRFAIAACACAAAAGCGAGSGTTLKFWTIGREGEVVNRLLPEFERTHPGVHVEVQQIPLTAAHEKLLTAFAGDALPDLCQLGNTWIPEFAALGALEPLQHYVDASRDVRSGDYFPGIWDTNVIDGTLYGVPWYVDTRLLFYRTDLLAAAGYAAPPRDWDEWRRAMAAVKAHDGAGNYAIFLPLNEFEPLLGLALQQPDPLLADDGTRGNFESTGFRRALGFYVEMFENGWAPPMSNTQISNVWDEFARGFFAFYITGPWNIGEFKRRLPEAFRSRWNTAPLPGPNGPGAGAAGGSSFAIFHSSTNKRLAWELAEFLSAVPQQEKFYELTGDLPARRSAWDFPALANESYARAFRDQLERVKPTPKVPEWERIAQEMQLMAERVIRGGEPIDRALREFDATTDAILAKRRALIARKGGAS